MSVISSIPRCPSQVQDPGALLELRGPPTRLQKKLWGYSHTCGHTSFQGAGIRNEVLLFVALKSATGYKCMESLTKQQKVCPSGHLPHQ